MKESVNNSASSNQISEENSNCQINCPINCPNRYSKARRPVLGGGYIFALIVALILAIQSVDGSYKRVDGEEDIIFATKSPPSALLVIGLTLIGLGLGVEIDKSFFLSSSKQLLRGIVISSPDEVNKDH